MARVYSLRKARKIMTAAYNWYCKQGHKLSEEKLALFESHLQLLDQALITKDREQANEYARKVDQFCSENFKKTFSMHSKELVFALIFALLVAVVVRQTWFELYEIPSGSMRPTYQEKDHLTVSKTQFGINRIMEPGHFYFDSTQLKRTGVIIFLGDNLPISDGVSYYFNLIPYSKRFIKRLIAKPGDTIYFYGGKIYGVDKDGEPLDELLDSPWMQPLEHIPILNFMGVTQREGNEIIIKQMNLPVGKIIPTPFGDKGEVFNGKKWIADLPSSKKHDSIQTYSDLWGIGNFAMARLLTKDQLKQTTGVDRKGLGDGVLYLELEHHPSLNSFETGYHTYRTILPLAQEHLDRIMENMYTTRFIVEKGRARDYMAGANVPSSSNPNFSDVPDGMYQIDRGTVQRVGLGGVLYQVPLDHPLYSRSAKNIQRLFNFGVNFNTIFKPSFEHPLPNRYAYFREGDFYLLNAPIMNRNDQALTAFVERELKRQFQGQYIAFIDSGAPKGRAFIETFGLKVPEGHYLVLGDNHAVSGDSRVMGFIPEDNIRGVPDLLLWPPGSRWFIPEQTPYPILTGPRVFVWIIASIIGVSWFIHHQRIKQKGIFRKKRFKH